MWAGTKGRITTSPTKLPTELRQIPGAVDVHVQQMFDLPNLQVKTDRTKVQEVGSPQRDVASSLLVALSGSFQTAPSFYLNPPMA